MWLYIAYKQGESFRVPSAPTNKPLMNADISLATLNLEAIWDIAFE